MTAFSSNDWGSESESKRGVAPPQSNDDFEFTQSGKPMKAIIGLVILVTLAAALAFFKPASDNVAKSPSLQDKGSAITQMNRAPGQTTGQSPSSTN